MDSNSGFDGEEKREILERLDQIEKALHELVDMYSNLQGFIRVLNWIGKASVWIANLAAAIAILWAVLKHNPNPPIK